MIIRNYYGLKNGERYIFGNIAYCRKMYKLGYSFKGEELTENFLNALCA